MHNAEMSLIASSHASGWGWWYNEWREWIIWIIIMIKKVYFSDVSNYHEYTLSASWD